MNGTKHNLAAIETLPQSVGTRPSSLGAFCRWRNVAELFVPKTRAVEYCRATVGAHHCICRGDWPGPSAILHV